MLQSHTRAIIFALLLSIPSAPLFPLIGAQSLPWYKKDYNLVLMLLSAAGLYEYCGAPRALDTSRIVRDTMGITHEDLAVSKGKYLERLVVHTKDCMTVPKQLRNLHNYDFFHMNSTEQVGPSCAWYMAFNARALQAIVQEQEPLTAANIREYVTQQLVPLAQQNKDFFKKLLGVNTILQGMKFYQSVKLVTHLGITNYYDICLGNGDDETLVFVSADKSSSLPGSGYLDPVDIEGYGTKYLVSDITALLKSIKQNHAPVIYIFLTVPSSKDTMHAVLLTIIKRGDKKPLLIYLNSNGNSLGKHYFDAAANTENSHVTNFVTSLDLA